MIRPDCGDSTHMKWYVYRLIDPKDGKPFYIGKGCGKRARSHLNVKNGRLPIHARINLIRDAGREPSVEIVERFESESEALTYEAHLISKTPGLENVLLNRGRPSCRLVTLSGMLESALKLKGRAKAELLWDMCKTFPRERLVFPEWKILMDAAFKAVCAHASKELNRVENTTQVIEALLTTELYKCQGEDQRAR